MCKAPKPPKVEKTPPPQYMTNPYTDNLFGEMAKRLRVGRSQFRIDRHTSSDPSAALPAPLDQTPRPASPPFAPQLLPAFAPRVSRPRGRPV